MDIQQLRYLIAVYEEENFSRASAKVHVTQPTLSQQVKKAEKELGVYLFERSSRKVAVTEHGKKLIPKLKAILDSMDSAIREVKEGSDQIQGRFTLAAIPTIAPYLLPEVLKKMKKKAPRLVLEVYELTTSLLIDTLRAGRIDMGVLSLPISERGIATQTLLSEPFYAAVSKNSHLAKRKTVSLKNIMSEKLLVLQEGHCFRDQSLSFCKKNPDDEQIIFQGSSLSSVLKMVAGGQGVTLIPKIAAGGESGKNLKFIPIENPAPARELGFVWRMTTPLSGAHKLFMDSVKETLNVS